ncbi:MAG: DUF5011 domain-containing protein [Clostridiaceae bacterium]|nr:DUF5011 domain-containing protein [Clostridiaceae bacterium]
MERKRVCERAQHRGKGQILKRILTFMLAVMIVSTSLPLDMVWADELPYSERPGDDEIILDDSVEEGELSDIDLDISHTISKKGDKAVVTVSAAPSESGQENGVTKITKVEIHQNGKLKKGKRADGKWEFTVKENGVYSFVIYYNSEDGEEVIVASPSEIEKIEPTTEAEPQKPGANTGGAGGAGGGGATLPEENTDQEITVPETEEGTTGDNNTEDKKENDGTVEGDSNQDSSNESDQKPSDNTESGGKEEDKGNHTDNQGGVDSSDQTGNGDSSTSGDNTDISEDKGNNDSSSSSDNNSNTSSNDNNDTGSSDNSSSGSADNGGSDSSSGNDSGSSDNGSTDSSGSSDSGSSDSGSSDNSGSDEGNDSSDTSIALNVIDFIFPVIEAQASDFTVKKAVIVEYEITNLFPEGDPEDVDVDIFNEATEEGAMITLLAEPSEIGLEKGVRKITDISLIDFEPEEDTESFDEVSVATDSEAEEEIIESQGEEEIEEASSSDATYNTSKSSNAKHAEYQESENEEGEYRFFVKENGIYTFSVRYGRAADQDFEDSTELVETQFSTTYELDSIMPGVQFMGVDDTTIQAGEIFDLMAGVEAVSDIGMELPVVIQNNGGFDSKVPGTYKVVYAVATRSILENSTVERTLTVMPLAEGDLSIISNIHGTEDGKTLEVKIGQTVSGILSLSYDLPVGIDGRVIKIAWPEDTTATNPTDNIVGTYNEVIDGISYKCYKISDGATGELTFDIVYQINYSLEGIRAEDYLRTDGHMRIGKIQVITTGNSSSGETQLAETSIGPLVTEKLAKGSAPKYVYGQAKKAVPAIYDMELCSTGEEIYPYAIGKPNNKTTWEFVSQSEAGYRPWVIKKMRIYAPSPFTFELEEQDINKGVTIGQDGEGDNYVDIPVAASYKYSGVTRLLERIRIVTKNGTPPETGTYTAKNTVITYMDYNDGEDIVEVDPFIQINASEIALNEVNCLKIERTRTETLDLPELTASSFGAYKITNWFEKVTDKDGKVTYNVPNKKENIKVTLSYPKELQANEWSISTGKTDNKFGTAVVVEKVVMHLESGATVDAERLSNTGFANNDSSNPDNSHVESVDIIFKEFYGASINVNETVSTGAVNSKISVITSAQYEDQVVSPNYNIIPSKLPVLKAVITGYNSLVTSAGKNGVVGGGYQICEDVQHGSKGFKGTNPKIIIDDIETLKYFSGRAAFGKTFIGGKISYTTSRGRVGEYEVTTGIVGQIIYESFVSLEDGETLTEVILSKEGIVQTWDTFNIVTFEMGIPYAEIVKDLQPEEKSVQLKFSGKCIVDEKDTPFDLSVEKTSLLIADVSLTRANLVSTSRQYKVYQGDTVTIDALNVNLRYESQNKGSATGRLPVNFVTYIKFENADKLAFMGTSDPNYKTELITKGGIKYIKVSQTKDIDMYLSSTSIVGNISYKLPPLQFMALAGSTIGTYPVVSEIYMDVDSMIQRHDKILDEWCLDVSFDALVKDELNLTESGDTDSLRMWKLDTESVKFTIEIIQQSLASVTVTPGLEEIYSNIDLKFYPTGRWYLNAMAGIGSGSSELKNYQINIPIPKEGKDITYSMGGLSEETVSEYDMYLRNEPRVVNHGIDTDVRYRLVGDTNFISSMEVGNRWDEVDELNVLIGSLPAKSTVLIYVDLEAEEKDNVGIGDKYAYIAASYKYNDGSILYGPRATYTYQDFQITGKSWIDNNENGKYDSGEPLSKDATISLIQNGTPAPTASYSFSNTNGNYILSTYLYENLSLKFEDFGGTTEGIKPTLKKANTNSSISVFEREGAWTASLPDSFKENQQGYDLGIVKLPILTANNMQVGYKSEAQANITVINQPNAPSVNQQIIYGASEDTSIATVSYTGLIKGLKENSLTTATASVINSLGDKVSVTYQIAVSDNKVPILTVHPWVAIEGDSIPDLWYGVTAEDPEEEYPAWKTILLGANKSSRSIPADNKLVTIYTNGDYTGEISLSNALSANGLYFVRYSVEDDKENLVMADTTLTVFGKMQGEAQIEKHYFASGATVRVDNNEFYYLDTTGSVVPVMVQDTSDWILNEGVLTLKSLIATHPKISDVTEGVMAGDGRIFEAELKGTVDSKVNAMPIADYIALVDEANVRIGWLNAADGTYKHYELSGLGTTKEVLKAVEDENGTVLTDTKTGTGVIEVDTGTPGVYQYVKTAEVLEDYDNIDVSGNPIKNTASQNIKVTVVGKPVVTVPPAIYITPDKAADETFIKNKISASANYHDGTNQAVVIPENQILYQFNKAGGKNTSVDVTAWGGRTDNLSEPVRVKIVTREVPVLTLPDIHLRKGTEYGLENFMDRVLTPDDEHNEYVYIQNNLDTNTLGKFEAQYRVSDNLTGASATPSQKIYVHGIPEIIATDKSLYAHQSTSEQALIDIVKLSAKAIVEYTKAEGTTEVKTIPDNELKYEVTDYVAGTAGRFKVTITANDKDYVPAGLAPMQVTKEVYVDVADQMFNVTFTTNSDNFHDRGTIDGGVAPVVKPTIYGCTAIIVSPAANEGYHFDGFKTLSGMKATQRLTLGDGTVIAAGSEIPVGTILSIEQVQTIEIYANAEFQAYFSSTPVLDGRDIKLYVGETYNQSDLGITVSDLDGDAKGIVVDDSHVDTSKAGTYQIKVEVEDSDQNHAEEYMYVQVYGKTKLEGYTPIHMRKGQDLSDEQLKGAIKAVYEAPPAVPDSPWSETSQPAVLTEIPFTMEGTVNTQEIGLTKLSISAEGQIEGHETDGQASAVQDVFVHGNPIITADDGSLYTHQSTDKMVLINLIKQNAAASVYYVEPNGSIRTETISAGKLNYEIKPEENYQVQTEGTYKVTISFNDTEYVPNGLQPVDTELSAAVIVSNKAYSVKFSINNDMNHHKGDYEGGTSEFNTNAIHGNPVGRVPIPVETAGYHFDGFKVLTVFTTTDDIQLSDGSTISAGVQIPVGTILTPAQIENLKIYGDLEFQAYFSATPVISGENLVLYEKEEYKQDKLHIEISDLDQNAQLPVIDDSHIDTDVAGTYQVKITVDDTDGNQTEKYLYVQVVGKTKFTNIPDLHIRKDSTVTEEQLLANVTAAYNKPEEIPEEPWTEVNKVNNGHAAITTVVEAHSFDVVNTDTVQKTKINLSAPGMIHGREMIGKVDAERNVYIHGLPVIMAYDNGIYTHQSTNAAILEQIVQTGMGTLERDAANAYVEYVQPDGSIKKVKIDPSKITYTVNQFVPLTAGDYTVSAKVDDFSVIAQAQAPDLLYVTGERNVKIVVADKMYSVMFEMGEHGGLEDPAESVTTVAHGKKVTSPKLAPEEGYTLDYWVDETGNRIPDLSSVVITENRKFTAEFKLKEFTVRFIGKKDRVIKTEIVKYGHDATPPTEDRDVKSNRFNGWSTSYTNITEDTDIYTTYWSKSGGGGPNGGGGYVPSGPGMNTTITDPGVPKNPFEDLVTIGTNPVPAGNMDIPVYTGLPKTGDVSVGIKANVGYQATLIDGTRALSEDEPLVGQPSGNLIHVFEDHVDWRKCILHIILLIISALEGIFYIFKRKKDKRILDKLRKELGEEDK